MLFLTCPEKLSKVKYTAVDNKIKKFWIMNLNKNLPHNTPSLDKVIEKEKVKMPWDRCLPHNTPHQLLITKTKKNSLVDLETAE